MVWESKGLNPHVSEYSCVLCVCQVSRFMFLTSLYIISPPILLLRPMPSKTPPIPLSPMYTLYTRQMCLRSRLVTAVLYPIRLDISVWYVMVVWLCLLCASVRMNAIWPLTIQCIPIYEEVRVKYECLSKITIGNQYSNSLLIGD